MRIVLERIIAAILEKPETFCKKARDETEFLQVLFHYIACAGIGFPLVFLGILADPLVNPENAPWGFSAFFFALAQAGIMGVFSCLYIGFAHIPAYLLGGRNGILRTAQAYVYGSTPSLVFGPVLVFLFAALRVISPEVFLGRMEEFPIYSLLLLMVTLWSAWRVYGCLKALQGMKSRSALLVVAGIPLALAVALYFAGIFAGVA